MDPEASALAALQAAKKKGLSYYDAVQGLQAQGFDQAVIDDASNRFDYHQGVIRSQESPGDQTEKQELDKELFAEDIQLRNDQIDENMEGFHLGRL